MKTFEIDKILGDDSDLHPKSDEATTAVPTKCNYDGCFRKYHANQFSLLKSKVVGVETKYYCTQLHKTWADD